MHRIHAPQKGPPMKIFGLAPNQYSNFSFHLNFFDQFKCNIKNKISYHLKYASLSIGKTKYSISHFVSTFLISSNATLKIRFLVIWNMHPSELEWNITQWVNEDYQKSFTFHNGYVGQSNHHVSTILVFQVFNNFMCI